MSDHAGGARLQAGACQIKIYLSLGQATLRYIVLYLHSCADDITKINIYNWYFLTASLCGGRPIAHWLDED